ncbi:MAG: MMPL family transporter [bacterium]|nr:MMPL family transporter [bacterium]
MVLFSVEHPKLVMLIVGVLTVLFAAMIPMVKVDTDPENMLSHDEPVRVFHNAMKEEFAMRDMVVVGVVNDADPDGVFNPDTLTHVYELTQFAKTLQWPDPDDPSKTKGVVEIDILAPSTVDDIEQAGLGSVRFEWLMSEPPKTKEDALRVRDRALQNPLLRGTLVSEDGKALALYLPLTSKDLSHRVYVELQKKIAEFNGAEQYHITGLPVAEDTFGYEMFIQMAISAPAAMLIIFLLMLYFFRKLTLVVSPMLVAMISVIWTMGLMIGTGNTVHIMSSMIPIFIMPIAVLDSIHILSDFFEQYQKTKNRKQTVLYVMRHLFTPMLYTSLTTVAGFASLALAEIPPVQVFGLFVAFGVAAAWVLTVTFIPAFTMFISDESLEKFGKRTGEHVSHGRLEAWLYSVGEFTYRRAGLIAGASLLVVAISVWGMTKIQINDNPVRWFAPSHPIRIADRVLNEHFGGTYMAFLELEPEQSDPSLAVSRLADDMKKAVESAVESQKNDLPAIETLSKSLLSWIDENTGAASPDALVAALNEKIDEQMKGADFDRQDAWDELRAAIERSALALQTFKRPDVLRYISDFQQKLASVGVVGKSNSISDIVKKIYMELFEGDKDHFRIPDTAPAVAQSLISYQNSHDPDDLWHMVTPDYQKASVWLQLKSGDNKDMEKVIEFVDGYFAQNPPPVPLNHRWYGLTYINVEWQNKMVAGMFESFMGSFLIVFLMMTILFSSPLWGVLCMIPLTITIGLIYGMIGLIGKDYDMPVAVLSSLTLGLAVDFAIHFLSRARELHAQYGNWKDAAGRMFGEPARAITRNIIVVAVGFLPLLLAPLVPYNTVGVFIASILAVSGVGTLLILPALITLLEPRLFKTSSALGLSCNCGVCVTSSVLSVIIIAMNLREFAKLDWGTLTWISAALIPVLAVICALLSRRRACAAPQTESSKGESNS